MDVPPKDPQELKRLIKGKRKKLARLAKANQKSLHAIRELTKKINQAIRPCLPVESRHSIRPEDGTL